MNIRAEPRVRSLGDGIYDNTLNTLEKCARGMQRARARVVKTRYYNFNATSM